jgi:hypothetical protein
MCGIRSTGGRQKLNSRTPVEKRFHMTLFGNPSGEVSMPLFLHVLVRFRIQLYTYEDVICFSNLGYLPIINSDICRRCVEKTI